MEQNAWTNELSEIVNLKSLFLIENQKIVKEIDSLVTAQNDEVAFLYARRTLEVIVTEICLDKLCRERGSEPLQSIIDRLHKDRMIPDFVHTSMQNLNKNATYGVHPKEFDTNQVRTTLLELVTVLRWYFKEKQYSSAEQKNIKTEKKKAETAVPLDKPNSTGAKKINLKYILAAIVALALVVIITWTVHNLNSKPKSITLDTSNSHPLNHKPVKNLAGPLAKSTAADTQVKNKTVIANIGNPPEDSRKQANPKIIPDNNSKTSMNQTNIEIHQTQKVPITQQEDIEQLFRQINDKSLPFADRKKVSARILNQFEKQAVISIFMENRMVDRMVVEDYTNRLLTLPGIAITINKQKKNSSGKITSLEVTEGKK